jgi:hypothetical protein
MFVSYFSFLNHAFQFSCSPPFPHGFSSFSLPISKSRGLEHHHLTIPGCLPIPGLSRPCALPPRVRSGPLSLGSESSPLSFRSLSFSRQAYFSRGSPNIAQAPTLPHGALCTSRRPPWYAVRCDPFPRDPVRWEAIPRDGRRYRALLCDPMRCSTTRCAVARCNAMQRDVTRCGAIPRNAARCRTMHLDVTGRMQQPSCAFGPMPRVATPSAALDDAARCDAICRAIRCRALRRHLPC